MLQQRVEDFDVPSSLVGGSDFWGQFEAGDEGYAGLQDNVVVDPFESDGGDDPFGNSQAPPSSAVAQDPFDFQDL